jgi:hypothetical protein
MKETKIYAALILLFFIFATVFPTIRLLSIGHGGSASLFEFVISALPDIFAVVVIIFSFFAILKNRKEIHFRFFDWVLISFALSNVIIGFIIADDVLISLYGFRMTYFPVCFYFLFRFCNDDFSSRTLNKIFYWFFLVGAAGIILYVGFYDQMVYMLNLSQAELQMYFIVRMTSVFWTPVVFAAFMGTGFLYFCYRYFTTGKWYFLLLLMIMEICILMSMSRGSIIAAIFAFILLSLLVRNWKRSAITLVTIVAVFFMTTYYIASPGEVFWWIAGSTMDTFGLRKGVSRVDLWLKAFANFKDHPFGYGLGKAGHVAARFYNENSVDADVFSTDGWFLKILNETGIWGVASYLFLAASYLIICLKSKLLKNKTGLLLFFFTMFIMINIQNIVSNVLDFYLFTFLFWAMLGASVSMIYKNQKQ